MTVSSSPNLMRQLVCSPCCVPKYSLAQLLPEYRRLGFTKFEGFSEWAGARMDWRGDPTAMRKAVQTGGFQVTSFHLPLIKQDNVEGGLADALAAAKYASQLGAQAVLFKAATREIFAAVGKRFLDGLEEAEIGVTPVVQNHKGTAISTLDDYREVFASLDNDPRLKAVLEVGHFARAGIDWQSGWDLLGDRIALIHVNEIREGESVLFGTGTVDFAGLLRKIKTSGYAGNVVVELELAARETDAQATFAGLRAAIDHLLGLYSKN